MKTHIARVDILRCVAVLCVFLFHSQLVLFPGYVDAKYLPDGLANLHGLKNTILNFLPTAFGWSGVSLFFIISGFVIHYGFLAAGQKFNALTFYSKRFWRIYPPYVIVLLFFCITGAGAHYYFFTHPGRRDLAAHLLMVHNLSTRYHFSINGSFWSLGTEVHLYLIYPVFLWLRKKLGINRAFVVVFISGFILGALAFRFLFHGEITTTGSFVFNTWFIWCSGALLAERYFEGRRLFNKKWALFIPAGFILAIAASAHQRGQFITNYLFIFSWLLLFDWVLHTSYINTQTRLSKAAITIGLCSYSIYLIHQPFLYWLYPWFNALGTNPLVQFLKIIPVFIIIFGICYVFYKLVELPAIKLGAYFRNKG